MAARKTKAPAAKKAVATIRIPVIAGMQGGMLIYAGRIPLKLLANIVPLSEDAQSAMLELPPEQRTQRQLDPRRVKAITNYVLKSLEPGAKFHYTFSSVALSYEEGDFVPIEGMQDMGYFEIPIGSLIRIRDGQHRLFGLQQAYLENREQLEHDDIPCVFYPYTTPDREQQAFSDMNGHAKLPPSSLNKLFDHRDPKASMLRKIVLKHPALRQYIELEKAAVSGKSMKLWPLQGLMSASMMFLRTYPRWDSDAKSMAIAASSIETWWDVVFARIPDLAALKDKEVTAFELRANTILPTQLALDAIALIGSYCFPNGDLHEANYNKSLNALADFDWSRSSPEIQSECCHDGRIVKNQATVKALANLIVGTK